MPKSALGDWIRRIRSGQRVVGPVQVQGHARFAEIEHPSDLVLDYPTTLLPPKKYLVPQREVLLSYRLDGSHVDAAITPQSTVILGVHTCDVHAIKLFDRVFSQGFVDQHYQAHRDSTTIISVECLAPCGPHSFCRDMGTGSAAGGYDLHMIDMGNAYAVHVGTEKGAALLHGFRHVFDAVAEDQAQIDARLRAKWQEFEYRLDVPLSQISELLGAGYRSPIWQELGAACLGCGMCTQVCPTCYCFDVYDEVDLELRQGTRVRRWDSCQINEFAMVAGGHNFRDQMAARQRHRFMRKGKYQMDAYEMAGCVGCGRCAASCLVHIHPIDVFNRLAAAQEPEMSPAAEEVPA